MSNQSELLDVRYKRETSLVTRQIAGETILVPVTRQMDREAALYSLDAVGGFLWNELGKEVKGEDLISALTSEYSVNVEQAKSDVENFLEQLLEIEAISPAK